MQTAGFFRGTNHSTFFEKVETTKKEPFLGEKIGYGFSRIFHTFDLIGDEWPWCLTHELCISSQLFNVFIDTPKISQ